MSKENGSAQNTFFKILFILGLLYLIGWFVSKTTNALSYFAIAGAFAYILNPAIDGMAKLKIPRAMAIFLMFAVFFGGIGLAASIILPEAKKEFDYLVAHTPQYFETLKGLWERMVSLSRDAGLPVKIETLPEKIASNFQGAAAGAGKKVFAGLSGFFSGLAALVVIPILVYYFLSDGHKMKAGLMKCVPPQYREETDAVLLKINKALGGFMRGQVNLCVAMGILTWGSLAVIGMEGAVIFGVVAGVTEFIPYLGPVLALIGPLLVATTISGKMTAIVLGLFLVIQLLEGNVLAPRILGKNVDMHPAFIVFILMASGELAGIPGMIAAMPVAVVLKVLFEHFYLGKVVNK